MVVRAGMAAMAALNLWWGAWALVSPRGFFTTFPGLGYHWTSAYVPYNEHLVVDLGATFMTLGALLGVAAAQRQRRVRIVVLGGVLLFDTLHLFFHVRHPGDMSPADYGLSTASLVVGVLVPLVLLLLELPAGAARPRVE